MTHDELVAFSMREKRDQLLRQDIDVLNPLRWASLTEEQQQAWKDYRDALLNIPQQPGFPVEIVWPVKPE